MVEYGMVEKSMVKENVVKQRMVEESMAGLFGGILDFRTVEMW